MHARPVDTAPASDPWLILVPLGLAGFMLIGAMLTSLSVYTTVMQPAFGWSETELGAGPVALLLGMSAGNLAVGQALRRIGVRATFALGCLVAGLGWIAAGSAQALPWFMAAMGLAGLGVGAATVVPGIALVTQAFHRHRGLAVALFIGSFSLASAIMPMATGRVIDLAGWRAAFRITGLVVLGLAPVLFWSLPRGGLTEAGAMEAADSGPTRNEALRLPGFWLLTASLTLSQLCMNGVLFNTVPFLQKSGVAPGAAIELYSLTNFMSLPGLLIGGYLSDRISARTLLPAILAVQALGTLALLGMAAPSPLRLAATALFVIAWGGVAGLPAQAGSLLLRDVVGTRSYSALLGLVFTVNGFVAALAPGATGWLHDLTGGFALPFAAFAGTLILAALAALLCRPLPA